MFALRLPVALALAGLLAASPLASASAAPSASGDAPAQWSVETSGSAGPDGRASFAYATQPGTQISDTVAITNRGTTAETFSLYATDAINDFQTGQFSLLPGRAKPTDSGAWITLAESTVTLQPGIQARVPFTMLVPTDATPGDHTAGIVASVLKPSTDKKGKSITLDQRVGARVYLDIAGPVAPKVAVVGLVSGFTSPWNPFGAGSAGVDYAISNQGNARVDVSSTLSLDGPFGIHIASIPLGRAVNLLPGQAEHVHRTTPGVPPLLLLWSTVRLTPRAPTDTIAASSLRHADGSPATPRPAAEYRAVTASTLTGAVPVTLLLVLLVLLAIVLLVVRYVRFTRERMYEAIDAATAEALAARQEPDSELESAGRGALR